MTDVIEKSKTVDKTLDKIKRGLDSLKDLINLRNCPGGIIGSITTRIMTEVERGPISNIHDAYCLKSEVRRESVRTNNLVRTSKEDILECKKAEEDIYKRFE